jgi:recombinase, phage recT family
MSADEKKKITFSVAISQPKFQKLINNCIPDAKTAARFTASITSAVAVNPALSECVPATIISGALLGESLGLSPSPQLGQYYLVPFKQKEKKDKNGNIISPERTTATFILGAKGYKQLAIRSNQYRNIGVSPVRLGEYKGRDPFSGDPIIEFGDDDTAPIIGYYAYFELLTGFRKCIYWTKEKMLEHADRYSQAFSKIMYEKLLNGKIPQSDMWKYSSYWYKNFDQMAEKTMMRQLLSQWGVLSPEMRSAFESDEREIKEKDGVLIPEEEPEFEPEEQEQTDIIEGEAEEVQEQEFEEQVSLNDL